MKLKSKACAAPYLVWMVAFIVAPLTLVLPAVGMGVEGVFLAEPVSNVIGGLACILTMYFTVYRPLGRRTGE